MLKVLDIGLFNMKKNAPLLIEKLVPKEIRDLSPYNVPSSEGMLKLDAMENPWTWPDSLVARWIDRLSSAEINRYPSADAGSLKLAIRKQMGVKDQYDILLGNGSDELIQLLIMLVAQSGRPILGVEPSFVMYKTIAKWLNVKYVAVPLNVDFQLDEVALNNEIESSNPAIIFIAQPNNPTGNLFDIDSIKLVIEKSSGLVVIDEAYTAFSDSDLSNLLDDYSNVLIMRTLSKVGLAGLRLGLLFGSPDWIAEINKVRLPYNINVLTQLSTEFALENFEVFEAQTDQLRKNRDLLFQELSVVPGLQVWPSSANFLLVRCLDMDAVYFHRELKNQGILVKILHGSHPHLDQCLRINVSSQEENNKLLEALKLVIK